MIKFFSRFCELIVKGFFVIIELFLLLCMNVFTVPMFVLTYLICKVFRLSIPHIGVYGLMIYPTWGNNPGKSVVDDLREIEQKEKMKIRKRRPIRAWEEGFFD